MLCGGELAIGATSEVGGVEINSAEVAEETDVGVVVTENSEHVGVT